VGKHSDPEQPPPPPPPHRPYRVVIALGAIVALAVLSMAIVAAIYPNGRGAAQTTGTGSPSASEPPFSGPYPTDSADPVGPPPTYAAGTAGPTTAVGGLTARYELIYRWAGAKPGFQIRLTLTNVSGASLPWQIRLSYGGQVRRMATLWVNGSDLPRTSRSGATYRITSTAPLPRGASIDVYAQFEAGTDDLAKISPSACEANGADCLPR
jgi:hypothetical protein